MKNVFYTLIALAMSVTVLFAQPPNREKTVIRNINIISVDASKPQVMEKQDVIIENGIIKKIKQASNRTYNGYKIVDGTNKYLIPGMADMHVHLPHPFSEIKTKEFYLLNLLNGVTTVRQMRGKPADLRVRDSIQKGLLLGGNTYISTPPFFWFDTAFTVNLFNSKMCIDSLKKYKTEGYDFIKYVGGLSLSQFDTLKSIAASLNLALTGHAPKNDLEKAVDADEYTIEHIEPYVKLYEKDSTLLWNTIDKMAAKHLFNCPDIIWYVLNGRHTPISSKREMFGANYIKKERLDEMENKELKDAMDIYKKYPVAFSKSIQRDSLQVATYQYLLPRMQHRGLQLLIGSCPGGFMVPGYCFILEMKIFVSSGISPYETIKCATYNAANCMHSTDKWGTISESKRADMVLLTANPLEDIDNIKKVEATILNGNVLTHEYLLAELKKLH